MIVTTTHGAFTYNPLTSDHETPVPGTNWHYHGTYMGRVLSVSTAPQMEQEDPDEAR